MSSVTVLTNAYDDANLFNVQYVHDNGRKSRFVVEICHVVAITLSVSMYAITCLAITTYTPTKTSQMLLFYCAERIIKKTVRVFFSSRYTQPISQHVQFLHNNVRIDVVTR